VVGNPYALISFTGLPMLGSITLNQPPAAKRAELLGLLSFAGLSIGLLLVYVGVNLGQGTLFA
jgi:hypothetical protein